MTDEPDPTAAAISALNNIIDNPPAGAPQFACGEDTMRVVHVILIGNPEDIGTSRYAQIYRDAGFHVTIEDTRSTCAIGGMTFHTIAVDELTRFEFSAGLRDIARGLRQMTTQPVSPEELAPVLRPKNQPHGPQRKGRGGKTRKW